MCIELIATFTCTHSEIISKMEAENFHAASCLPLDRPTLECATWYHFNIDDTCGFCKAPSIICSCTDACRCESMWAMALFTRMRAASEAVGYDTNQELNLKLLYCLTSDITELLNEYRCRLVSYLRKTHTWEETEVLAPWLALEQSAPWFELDDDDDDSWAGSISEDDFGDDDPVEGLCLGCSDCGTDEYEAHSSDSETDDDENENENDGSKSGADEDEKDDSEHPECRSDRHENDSSKHPECAPDKYEDDNSQCATDEYESDSLEYSDDGFWDY